MADSVSLNAETAKTRAASSGELDFVVEIFDGADEALAALEAIERGLVSIGFQTLDWLTVLYEELASSHRALPRLVVVTDRLSGDVMLALPLVIVREGSLRVASFADLGVSDYGAPLLGPLPTDGGQWVRRLWRAVRAAMRDVDLIRFERMPAKIGDRENPLLPLFGCAEGKEKGYELVLRDGFEGYLRSLGKKYRKDLARCFRLLKAEGSIRFFQAVADDEIAHVFATLEEQQAVWHAARGTKDILADPATRLFYERLAIDGADAGLTRLFALEVNGRIVAALLGLLHKTTFTLLRISTDGEQWSYLSPGRLMVLETAKYLAASGVRRFDMGVHSNPLKHGFGVEEVPLYDLVIAQDLAALPIALVHELRVHLRASRRLRSVIKRAMPRLAG